MTRVKFVWAALAVLLSLATIGMARAEDSKAPSVGGVYEMAGVGLYVADVERSVKFYTDVMGMKLVYRSKGEGVPRETILSISGELQGGMGVSIYPASQDKLVPGRTAFGRIIAYTLSSKVMQERVRAAGIETKLGADGKHLYFKDPDGYEILVYEMEKK